jgi:hypothetical protein
MLQGLRDKALVLVSGREGGLAGAVGHAWGGGITAAIIRKLFDRIGLTGVEFVVDVLAAFSTGYRGMIGTINNYATDTATLDLTHVRRVVVFDALYRGDEPAPGGNYKKALAAIDSATGNQVELIIYDLTQVEPRGRTATPASLRRGSGRRSGTDTS